MPGELETYRKKRTAGATPEPFGGDGERRGGLFVVQQHAARSLHFDLRLAIGGTLRSWAVPKGPSLDPQEKRLAVATEDHPLEYADFEGVIPAGNYGAGAMIVWDRGLAVHHLDPEEGLVNGKLLFELRGYKLRGLFTLVLPKKKEREWLLIKKPDAWASGADADELGGESVLSGLTVAELASGRGRAEEIRRRLGELGARPRRLEVGDVTPMLAQAEPRPFSRPGWLFEIKYDGYRALAGRAAASPRSRRWPAGGTSEVRLLYRSGREATAAFPEIARALAALPYEQVVFDGELVVLDDEARPSFQRLQRRGLLTRPADVERAAVEVPATFYIFDLLAFEGFDLRALPLARRKELLREILPAAGPLRFADHVLERGEELYAAVRERGVEGVVAKRADSPYRGGRSGSWVKIRAGGCGDFAVVGFTRPGGSRDGFGALHLAVVEGTRLVYAGKVGSGFTAHQIRDLHRRLLPLARREPAVAGPLPRGRKHVWVEPRLVVEVRYAEITAAGQLRHPVFARLRDDKGVEDCIRDEPTPAAEPAEETSLRPPRRLRLTRREKVFWPEEGLTKGDLLDYYRAIAPWLLPYLKDRPLVLDRFPDGIAGKSFFQKNAPDYAPEWVRTEAVWSQESTKETRYFVCDDVDTLLYLVNLGAIPLHVWASRVTALPAPDWSILDIDAKQSTFEAAVDTARAIHRLCREIDLPCFAKTSGATGLHVLIPLGGQCTHQQSRQLAELLARVVAEELPEVVSLARTVAGREGRIYLDFLQNGYGKLLVAPFSARPLPGAPVSMPLAWSEVTRSLDPKSFTIETAPQRMSRLGRDPLAPVLGQVPDLTGALARLAERV